MKSFRSGILPARDTIICAEHLEVCTECNNLFKQVSNIGIRQKLPAIDFSPVSILTGKHLSYEQISDYLDNYLEEHTKKTIDYHLEFCPTCYGDLSSLKEFRESIDQEVVHPHRSIAWRLAKSILKPWGRIRIFRLVNAYSTLIVLISLSLLAFAVYLWRNRDLPNPPRNVTEVKATPGSSPPEERPSPPAPQNRNGIERVKHFAGGNKRKIPVVFSIVIYDNGQKLGLDNQGNPVGIQNLPAEIREDVANVLRGKRIEKPALPDELKEDETSVRGNASDRVQPLLLNPISTLVQEDRPVLKWTPVKDATSYIVDIVDESFNPIAQSRNQTITEWMVDSPLKRDYVYLWQVIAYKDKERIEAQSNQMGQIGKFKIISEGKLNEIDKARKKFSSHLALAIFYLKEGLLDDAEQEFQKLKSDNPGSQLVERIYEQQINRRN